MDVSALTENAAAYLSQQTGKQTLNREIFFAPVVQWIEQIRPKDEIEVRFLSRAPERQTDKLSISPHGTPRRKNE